MLRCFREQQTAEKYALYRLARSTHTRRHFRAGLTHIYAFQRQWSYIRPSPMALLLPSSSQTNQHAGATRRILPAETPVMHNARSDDTATRHIFALRIIH